MSAMDGKKLEPKKRKLITHSLRRYFDELKADLEADSEAFFHNVISRAAGRQGAQPSPQHRRS